MIEGFSQLVNSNSHNCEVCGSVLSYLDFLSIKGLGYSVCRSMYCKQVMDKKTSMATFQFKSHLKFSKKILHQRRERDLARKKYIDEVTAKELQENQQIYQSVMDENPDRTPQNTHLLVIPSSNPVLIATPDQRVSHYVNHLESIVQEAGEYSNASEVIYDEHHDANHKRLAVDQRFVKNPLLHEMSDRLCSLCKGGCCASGKEHAYLSVFSIRKFMDNNPERSAAEIIDLYRSRVRPEIIENSCINQTATGCALPRNLRSDICNGFYCEPLKSYQKKMEGKNKPTVVLAIQRSSTYWERLKPGISNNVINVELIDVGSTGSID